MKYFSLLVLSMCFSLNLYSQERKPNLSDSCSNYFDIVSYFWKNDSLGHNGFRLYTYESFLKCKMDKISLPYLFEKLGKPSEIDKDQKGVYYIYYYFDGKTLPKAANKATERLSIHFYFEFSSPYLKYVGERHSF
jgi:hypothetical protein